MIIVGELKNNGNHIHAGETLYPPTDGECPSAASKPAETSMMSGLYSLATGKIIERKAARYSLSP